MSVMKCERCGLEILDHEPRHKVHDTEKGTVGVEHSNTYCIFRFKAELEKRDELLRECHDKYHAHNDGCDQHADGIDGDCDCGLFVFLERVESAINPAPVQADEQNCGDCGDDGEEPNPDCHTCGGSGAKR